MPYVTDPTTGQLVWQDASTQSMGGSSFMQQQNPFSIGYNPQQQQQLQQTFMQPTTGVGGGTQTLPTQQTQGGFSFGDLGTTDWLNFGTGLASLGAGIYYQNQALDQQQQSLDLAQSKYDTYQKEQQDLDNAYASFG